MNKLLLGFMLISSSVFAGDLCEIEFVINARICNVKINIENGVDDAFENAQTSCDQRELSKHARWDKKDFTVSGGGWTHQRVSEDFLNTGFKLRIGLTGGGEDLSKHQIFVFVNKKDSSRKPDIINDCN